MLRLICCRQNLAPLHVAIVPDAKQTEIIELLLLHGADVDAKDTCAFDTCQTPSQ
jgi:ankyrin repeat protein